MNQNQFLLDSGFWGWLYKLLYPVEWLMTQIMAVFHKFLVMLGMNEIGFSWVMSIVFLVLVVQACVFPLFYKSMKGMRKMQAQMTVLQPKMQRIQNKYKGKNDPASKEAMQREMMKLYQDNDANPMGGCTSMLPMFVQGPVFMCMFYTLSAIPYIARGKFRDGQGLGAFDIATAKQFTSTTVFGVNVADNFTTAAVHGKVVIAIFVALMCFCLWFMQYNSMKRNMVQSAANKQTEMMQKMMLWMFPIMYIFSGIAMPFAVLVYWLTNNICNLLRSIWQIHVFPTPGSPAAEAKEKRDHVHENARRAKAGLPSLEEEALQKAKEAAEVKEKSGYELLCADAFLVGFHQDRGAVLVGARHHQHVIALHALVARVYVGGHAESGDVTDMTGAVSIRPSNIHQNMTHGARLYKAPYPAFSMYFGSWIFIGGWTCDHRFQSFEIVCIIICISADLSTLLHYVTIIFHISTDFRGLVAQRNSNPLRYRHGHSTTPSGQR